MTQVIIKTIVNNKQYRRHSKSESVSRIVMSRAAVRQLGTLVISKLLLNRKMLYFFSFMFLSQYTPLIRTLKSHFQVCDKSLFAEGGADPSAETEAIGAGGGGGGCDARYGRSSAG